MISFSELITLALYILAVASTVASLYAIWVLITRRYQAYKERYREFLEQKNRVKERLRQDRPV